MAKGHPHKPYGCFVPNDGASITVLGRTARPRCGLPVGARRFCGALRVAAGPGTRLRVKRGQRVGMRCEVRTTVPGVHRAGRAYYRSRPARRGRQRRPGALPSGNCSPSRRRGAQGRPPGPPPSCACAGARGGRGPSGRSAAAPARCGEGDLSRGRTPLSQPLDKHHENSAPHTVTAAPRGRTAGAELPGGRTPGVESRPSRPARSSQRRPSTRAARRRLRGGAEAGRGGGGLPPPHPDGAGGVATGDSPPPAAGRRSWALGMGRGCRSSSSRPPPASSALGPGEGCHPLAGASRCRPLLLYRCGGPLVGPAGPAAFEVQGLGCPSPGSVPEDRARSLPHLPEARVFPF